MCLELWMWAYQKYEINWIVRKLYWVEYDDCTYLNVHDDSGMNRRNNVTYDLQCKNGKILMPWNIVIKVLQVGSKC